MKNTIRIILLCSFLELSICSLGSKPDQTPTEIIIQQTGVNNGGPRMPALIPIRGAVFGDTIYLSFSADLDEIELILSEESSGVVVQTSIDTSSSVTSVQFSGDPGEYTIIFTLQTGIVYEGAFSIQQ